MRDWNKIPDRRAATIIFRDFMEQPANAQIKKNCCDSPEEAKRQFAILGEFYLQGKTLPGQPPNDGTSTPIPKIAEFRVYDTRDTARHNLVVLILPSSKGKPTNEPANILIAAWPVWGPTRQQIADLEAQLVMLRHQLAEGEEGPPVPP
jgi:hypothetical protein